MDLNRLMFSKANSPSTCCGVLFRLKYSLGWLAIFALWLSPGVDFRTVASHGPSNGHSSMQEPFVDMQETAHIHFKRLDGADGKKELIETMGSGVAIIDYNDDGLPDVFLVNGAVLPSLTKTDPAFFNRLYRNDGGFRFTDVTESAGLQGAGYGMGVAMGDYDNDGFPDLYVTNYGENELYRNRGDGTFVNETSRAGVAAGGWSTSAAFFDYDRDGYLDLFVCRYVLYEVGKEPSCGDRQRGLLSYCLPDLFKPATDLLFHNNGDGTFRDASHEAGIGGFHGRGLGVTVGDFDRDGWPDIFVANDRSRNFLFRNKHNGTFEEVSLPSGVAYSMDGQARAGMGTDFGDFNGDGWPDIVVNNFETEGIGLFQNVHGKYFIDMGGQARLRDPSFPYVGFGGKFFDYDNDGRLDIFVANGHTQDDVSSYKATITYPEPKLLFRNLGNVFSVLSDAPGGALSTLKVSRGAAFGDLDNDGAIDVVVNNTNDFPQILRNTTDMGNNVILLKLVGSQSHRDGIGTKIEVRCDRQRQFLEAKSAASYLSANDLRVHVGLGPCRVINEIILQWPSGQLEKLRDLRSGYLYVVSEDKGVQQSKKLGSGNGLTERSSVKMAQQHLADRYPVNLASL